MRLDHPGSLLNSEPAAQPDATEAAAAKTASSLPENTAADATEAADTFSALGGGVVRGPGAPSGLDAWMHDALRSTPSWLVSMVVHMVILLVMALLTLPEGFSSDVRQLLMAEANDQEFDVMQDVDVEPMEDIDVSTDLTAIETMIRAEDIQISASDKLESAPISLELSDIGLEHAPRNDLLATVGAYTGTGLSGRDSTSRERLVRKYGGTVGSEKAVAAALKWLALHQCPDGGWCYDLTRVPNCGGRCRHSGTAREARIAATAMALLPFLGAGQTHKAGEYKETVNSGLYYLRSRMKLSPQGGSLWEPGAGRMYSHGLASIALCEAYAMTRDKGLYGPAQAAVNFICYAQDPIGGGWRYEPRQKGDTSVVGWQIMALKSAHMAYLKVPPITVQKASYFLDSVQTNGGANYGYTNPIGGRDATTAIGLLCRMYLGWKKDYPPLQRGVQWLSDKGPSKTNMYYNYYATQVMRHWEGEMWEKWNEVMRDQLVDSQSTAGHETGSWHISDGDHERGRAGRLYYTAMAAMVLEVYYRHLPIYGKQSTEDDFPE